MAKIKVHIPSINISAGEQREKVRIGFTPDGKEIIMQTDGPVLFTMKEFKEFVDVVNKVAKGDV